MSRERRTSEADVVIVGAGPAGSSMATFLAQRGIQALVLDKSDFPRDKVCGDGLTPQAIYWLERLGCVQDVLSQTSGCFRDCDLYMNGEHLLTGHFPADTDYPDFSVILDRRRLDATLLENARKLGAQFKGECKVTGVRIEDGAAVVDFSNPVDGACSVRAHVVIGADGTSSIVSRSLGNQLKAGATAVSIRTYFRDATPERSAISVFFDERYFPGYGWAFVDDDGAANVGMGYACDPHFPMPINLHAEFERFLAVDLRGMLAHATQCAGIAGGAASFYRPASLVQDHALLIGDAANQADPLNGGGIHRAMEGAWTAAEAVARAFDIGDFSAATLRSYEESWNSRYEADRRAGELFLTVAKNPALRHFNLFLLRNIGRLCASDANFERFAAGVFSGIIAQSAAISPLAVLSALPIRPSAWLSLMRDVSTDYSWFPVGFAASGASGTFNAFLEIAQRPVENADWGLELLTKSLRLVDSQLAGAYRQPASREGKSYWG